MPHRNVVAIRPKPLYGDFLPVSGQRLRNNDLDRQHVISARGASGPV